jgi:hypothetical protein
MSSVNIRNQVRRLKRWAIEETCPLSTLFNSPSFALLLFILELTIRAWSFSEFNRHSGLEKNILQVRLQSTDIFAPKRPMSSVMSSVNMQIKYGTSKTFEEMVEDPARWRGARGAP